MTAIATAFHASPTHSAPSPLHPGAFYPPGWSPPAVLHGFKLFRIRRDGSLGPLFINRLQRIPLNVWLPAEDHPTKGFAHRPGWHICSEKLAPHLKMDAKSGRRQWFRVEFSGETPHPRPPSQGGLWFTAKQMRVLEMLV